MEQRRTGSAHPRYRHTMAGLALLIMVAPEASANDCQLALESWTRLSATRLRLVPQSEGRSAAAHGACVSTEAVRSELLEGLARARALCAQVSGDQSMQQTLVNINQTFITSLAVCQPAGAGADAGWVTKSAPGREKPMIAAPPPPPPPAPPRPVVAAPPPAPPPKPAIGTPPPTPPCLEISGGKDDQYVLVNRRCRGHTVLAVIETPGAKGGETVCKGYTISQGLAVRSPRETPRVNYECLASQGSCNKDRLGGMFPECDW